MRLIKKIFNIKNCCQGKSQLLQLKDKDKFVKNNFQLIRCKRKKRQRQIRCKVYQRANRIQINNKAIAIRLTNNNCSI